jgi:hypothetical protein
MMMRRWLFALGSFVALSHAVAQSRPTPASPPAAPRLVQFGDTLGANFSIADSATLHGTPADFDFLVGVWEFEFQPRRADGEFYPPFHGHWTAVKKLSPNAFIEDHFRADDPGAPADLGTWTYRVYNPTRKLWTMQGVGSENGYWQPGLCWSNGGNRYLIQRDGAGLLRIRYSNITDTSFLWRADRTADGGKTWVRDWWTMRARRIAK